MGRKMDEALDRAQRAAYEAQRAKASSVTKALNAPWLDEALKDLKSDQGRRK